MKKFVRVLLPHKNNTYLVLNENRNSNRWNFPGGKVEENESLSDACIREVFEETNLKICELEILFRKIYDIDGEIWEGYYFITDNYKGNIRLKEDKSISFTYLSVTDFLKHNIFISSALQSVNYDRVFK